MDLRGQVLVPPLAEAHNHNLQTAWGWQQFAQRYLDEGVFYAAMLCGDPASVAGCATWPTSQRRPTSTS